MEYGLIGMPLTHSYSPLIHSYLGDYSYELKELTSEKLEDFICSRSYKAINVTIPYKEAVIPYLDYVDEASLEIGAINTIINEDGVLKGYNTDYYGLKNLIINANIELKGQSVLILGTGGTSKTAYAVATSLNASWIKKVSRHPSTPDAITYEDAYADYKDVDYIINTTPVGMYPNIDNSPIDLKAFTNLKGVIDVIYNPYRSKLLLDAKELNIRAIGGLYMLVAQAHAGASLFFRKELPLSLLESTYKGVRSKVTNLVLIGMPSSGKTTIGKILGERLNMEFIDSDDVIIDRIKMPIKEFFASHGEDAFRDVEADVINELSMKKGVIIATGGGAVLRPSNVTNLQANGRLFFIDCPLELLTPTNNRPLSQDNDALKAMYSLRHPIYESYADYVINASTSIEEEVQDILKYI